MQDKVTLYYENLFWFYYEWMNANFVIDLIFFQDELGCPPSLLSKINFLIYFLDIHFIIKYIYYVMFY